MKRIEIIKASPAFIKAVKDAQKKESKLPNIPKEIREFVKNKTEETFLHNGGDFDKQAFRLGMFTMWFKLNELE